MRVTNSYSPNFSAKFIPSDDLQKITKYALEHGRAEQLAQAHKNISKSHIGTKLDVTVGQTTVGYPKVEFTRITPNKELSVQEGLDASKSVVYASGKMIDPFKFALQQILKMGNNAPENKTFQQIVVGK